jgi:transposase
MAERQFHLTDAQADELCQAFRDAKDGLTRTRYQAVRLYGSGYSVSQVQEICTCSRSALMTWCRTYRTQGLLGLRDGRVGGNRAKLSQEQRQKLRTYLHRYTPRQLLGSEAATADGQFWTVPDLRRALERWFGLTFDSPTSYQNLFAACDLSYQRTQKVFKSRRESQVMAFEEGLEKNCSTLPRTPPRP